jgi:phosphodiesterase/alkaline phosphatase D-like protein
LWTRVTPTAEATPGSGAGPEATVRWQLAADAGFAAIVAAGEVATGPARDHTIKVDVRELTPATRYWYRFGLGRSGRRSGRRSPRPRPTPNSPRCGGCRPASSERWAAGWSVASGSSKLHQESASLR